MDCRECTHGGCRHNAKESWKPALGAVVPECFKARTEATEDPAPSGQAEFDLLAAARELAEACRANCATICVCSPEYKNRGKQDPACEFCEIGKHLLPLADKILAGI